MVILTNNRALITPGQLKGKPFNFALNGLVLPSIVIGLLYAAASGLYSFPPPQIDRAIDDQKNIQKILNDVLRNDALHPSEFEPAWAHGVSTEEMVNESKRNTERLNQLIAESNSPPGLRDAERAELDQLRHRTIELVPVYVNRSMHDVQVSGMAALKESVNNQLKLLRVKKFVEVTNSWQSVILGVTLVIAAYIFGWLIR